MRTLMVTGDYHHTAVAVARGVGMVAQDAQVVIIQSKSEVSPAAHTKPIVSALKQQANGPHRLRSVSFRLIDAESEAAGSMRERRSSTGSVAEQSCEELRFSLCTGDVYRGNGGLSALASIAQVDKPCMQLPSQQLPICACKYAKAEVHAMLLLAVP